MYGHHMKNGTMFAGLEQYRSAEFFEEHRTIFFDMLAGTGDYEVFAVFCMTGAEAGEQLAPYLAAETKEQVRPFDGDRPGEKPPWAERDGRNGPGGFLTLMTCEYTQNEGRLFLMAYETGGEA